MLGLGEKLGRNMLTINFLHAIISHKTNNILQDRELVAEIFLSWDPLCLHKKSLRDPVFHLSLICKHRRLGHSQSNL